MLKIFLQLDLYWYFFQIIRSEALSALSETELKELIQSVHEYYDNKVSFKITCFLFVFYASII